MDLALIIKTLEVMTEIQQMIHFAEIAADRDKDGTHCRIQNDTIEKWKETHSAMSAFVNPYKLQALEWKFQSDAISAKHNENKMTIKKLPWTCGECGSEKVQNLRAYRDVIHATCDQCGAEWTS